MTNGKLHHAGKASRSTKPRKLKTPALGKALLAKPAGSTTKKSGT